MEMQEGLRAAIENAEGLFLQFRQFPQIGEQRRNRLEILWARVAH